MFKDHKTEAMFKNHLDSDVFIRNSLFDIRDSIYYIRYSFAP
jgi:hypothetical protein